MALDLPTIPLRNNEEEAHPIVYRNTFISLAVPEAPKSSRRPKSLPAALLRASGFAPCAHQSCVACRGRRGEREVDHEEEHARNYVGSLIERSGEIVEMSRSRSPANSAASQPEPIEVQERLQQRRALRSPREHRSVHSSAFSKTSARSRKAEVEVIEMEWIETETENLTLGSYGHPELCKRPCTFFLFGNCKSGTTCNFCHLGHGSRPKNLDKRHREQLRSLSEKDRLSLILPLLSQRARTMRLTDQVSEVLEIAAAWETALGITQIPNQVGNQNLWPLRKALSQMSFAYLIGHVVGRASRSSDGGEDDEPQRSHSGFEEEPKTSSESSSFVELIKAAMTRIHERQLAAASIQPEPLPISLPTQGYVSST
jgi:hypothetical protein